MKGITVYCRPTRSKSRIFLSKGTEVVRDSKKLDKKIQHTCLDCRKVKDEGWGRVNQVEDELVRLFSRMEVIQGRRNAQ
jgi:hypothetical protein